MRLAEASAMKKKNLTSDHPDMQMETYLMRGPDDQIYILHDLPFKKTLAWVEFNPQTAQIAFIMEDGELRDFGIPIEDQFIDFIMQQEMIAVALINNGQFVSGNNYALIKYEV